MYYPSFGAHQRMFYQFALSRTALSVNTLTVLTITTPTACRRLLLRASGLLEIEHVQFSFESAACRSLLLMLTVFHSCYPFSFLIVRRNVLQCYFRVTCVTDRTFRRSCQHLTLYLFFLFSTTYSVSYIVPTFL